MNLTQCHKISCFFLGLPYVILKQDICGVDLDIDFGVPNRDRLTEFGVLNILLVELAVGVR